MVKVVSMTGTEAYDARFAASQERLVADAWPEHSGALERFPAVNAFAPERRAEMLAAVDVHTRYVLQQGFGLQCSKHEIETLGAVGCFLSHRKLWEELAAAADDSTWWIILEDDVIPTADFQAEAQVLSDAMRRLRQDASTADLVLLGWRLETASPLLVEGPAGTQPPAGPLGRGAGTIPLHRVCGIWHGTHAYALSVRGARRLLAEATHEAVGSHVDHWMGELNAVDEELVVLRPTTPLFETQGGSVLQHHICWRCFVADYGALVGGLLGVLVALLALELCTQTRGPPGRVRLACAALRRGLGRPAGHRSC